MVDCFCFFLKNIYHRILISPANVRNSNYFIYDIIKLLNIDSIYHFLSLFCNHFVFGFSFLQIKPTNIPLHLYYRFSIYILTMF